MRIKKELNDELANFKKAISLREGEWSIKGFIDVHENIYTMVSDTKVISKILEIAIFPQLLKFSQNNGYEIECYEIELAHYQNYYPDITLIDINNGNKYAIDLKTTYRRSPEKINGMTLGAFTGYFRDRDSTKNISYPYKDYKEHFILGVIYTRGSFAKVLELLNAHDVQFTERLYDLITIYLTNPTLENWERLSIKTPEIKNLKADLDCLRTPENTIYSIENLHEIESVITDFTFFFVEKWRIAKTSPGSGNTKNIGSIDGINNLLDGKGSFANIKNGKKVFNDYWIHYETADMARKNGRSKPLFRNLEEYYVWRSR